MTIITITTIIFSILFVISVSLFLVGFAFDLDCMIDFSSKSAVLTGIILIFCILVLGFFEIIKLL